MTDPDADLIEAMGTVVHKQTDDWTRWSDERPVDATRVYRWRVSARKILGLMLRPEWSDKLHFVGMGRADHEWWPPYSHWDGYKRTVDPTLEWRLATAAEPKDSIFWGGLDLLPSPFTGDPPQIESLPAWIGAPPYRLRWLGIKSWMVNSLGWEDAARMRDAWNCRAALSTAKEVAKP